MTREAETFLTLLVLTILLILGVKYIFPLVAPFLLGAIFACLIEPLLLRMERAFKLHRRYVAMILITGLIGAIFLLFFLTSLMLYNEAQRLLGQLAEFAQQLSIFEKRLLEYVMRLIPEFSGDPSQLLFVRDSLNRVLRSLLNQSLNLAPRLSNALTFVALGGMAAYLFSCDQPKIGRTCPRWLPKKWRGRLFPLKSEVVGSMAQFVRTQVLLVLHTIVVTMIIFRCLGFSSVVGYGLLSGFLDLVPVLGPGLIYIPTILVLIFLGKYQLGVSLAVGYFLLIATRQFIELKLLGQNLDLHPLLTMLGMYVGMKLFGFVGVFFGPLILITLRGYYRVAMLQDEL